MKNKIFNVSYFHGGLYNYVVCYSVIPKYTVHVKYTCEHCFLGISIVCASVKLQTISRSLVRERINIAEAHYGNCRAETKLAKYLVVTHWGNVEHKESLLAGLKKQEVILIRKTKQFYEEFHDFSVHLLMKNKLHCILASPCLMEDWGEILLHNPK